MNGNTPPQKRLKRKPDAAPTPGPSSFELSKNPYAYYALACIVAFISYVTCNAGSENQTEIQKEFIKTYFAFATFLFTLADLFLIWIEQKTSSKLGRKARAFFVLLGGASAVWIPYMSWAPGFPVDSDVYLTLIAFLLASLGSLFREYIKEKAKQKAETENTRGLS